MEWVNKLLEALANPTVIMVVSAVVEFSLRYVKSEKPMSIIRAAVGVLKLAAKALNALADFADKVLGQRLK